MSDGSHWLGKTVRVFAGYDWRKEHGPMVEGEVVAYIGGPSVIVRDDSGNQKAWPLFLPIDVVVPEPSASEGLWR